jgi:GNAT superfamily N-acetyltransferase
MYLMTNANRSFVWKQVTEAELPSFKRDMQQAFQRGAEQVFGPLDRTVLPEEDIDRSLAMKGAASFMAVVDGHMAGGAIVVVDEAKAEGELAFLYVRPDYQGRKLGQSIWSKVEATYPAVKLWQTCTPYFEKRNIHFYINCCGFHAVEFYGSYHPEPDSPYAGGPSSLHEDEAYFFRFEKRL